MNPSLPPPIVRRLAVPALCAVFITALSACELITPPKEQTVWMYTDPIQCLGNPWQRDWLERHDAQYEEYPTDRELEIFRRYYERQGISVFEVHAERIAELVCAACSCPTGMRYFVLTSPRGAERLKDIGFKEGEP